MTVNHDAVGSSPTGGAIQALLRQCFFVVQNTLNTELRSRWQRLRSAVGGEKANRVWCSGRLFAGIRAKKAGTARGSVTVNHDAVGSSPTGGAKLSLK